MRLFIISLIPLLFLGFVFPMQNQDLQTLSRAGLHAFKKPRPKYDDLFIEIAKSKNLIERLRLVEPFIYKKQTKIRNSAGMTLLHIFSRIGDNIIVKMLINTGLTSNEINSIDNQGKTPLLLACLQSNIFVIETLIRAGADINFADPAGWTPLHYAAYIGDLYSVRYLLQAGADLSKQTNDGLTALHFATRANNYNIVSLLLKQNAPINIKDRMGKYPEDYALTKIIKDCFYRYRRKYKKT